MVQFNNHNGQTIISQSIIPEKGFVRLPQVLAVYPISRSSFWAGVKSGKYPKPIKLSPRCTAWHAEDIHALIASHKTDSSKMGYTH
ncbi:MAG: AlpA family phage regulatory protein [Pseudomonadota bacterium]